ncbi:MAG: CRP-like cAMP-binding protein [Myxococcota bacterium]|jgi:CRP-like cAMP-binding protein
MPDRPKPFTETDLEAVSPDAPAWYHLPTFNGIPEAALDALARQMDPVEFTSHTAIIQQGTAGDFMYVLTAGTVRVVAETTRHDTLFEILLKAPCVVGEMALLTRETRTATVRTESAVTGLRIDIDRLEGVLSNHPKAAHILTTIVGRRLLEADTITNVGQYKVSGRLGRGAMATVFEAEQPNLKRPVALKMLSHALVNYPGFADHFRHEARLIASMDHPNIVKVHDTVEGYGTLFIVMERLTGTGLDETINNLERLDYATVRRIMRETCEALHYSHEKGLLHRDIKPSNIFVAADGRVKLLDFGIAVQQEKSATKGGRMAGTPYYMSPEQILGRKLDGRSDLYATGILAYQILTHKVPFDATRLDALWRMHLKKAVPDARLVYEDVPDDLVEFIARATAKKKEDRFASCGEAAEFLRGAERVNMIDELHQASISIIYDGTRGEHVSAALKELRKALRGVHGVSLHIARKQPRSQQ